ncbi:hypothetical protein BLOT_003231 [Blomia tropicalis]|nr:hypothetical protein BLOT_003231 [Blomia tropicalis]
MLPVDAFHNEFEKIGHRFLKEINETYKQNFSGSTLSKSLRQQEERCLNLWIKSLEYLVILQESPGQRCPRHFLTATITGRDSSHTVGHRHLNNQSSTQVISNKRDLAPLSRSYNSVFNATTIQSSTPYGVLLRHASAQHYHRPMFGKKVERMSASGGGGGMNGGESSVNFRNRRVQTTRSGNTMNEQELVVDTHTLDGSGSPSADSGVFSSSTEKYEIIQKDIGYSSDADMSDAIEAHPHSADQNSSQRSARKRQIRRRRTRTARPRPWSYHADWTDWDYYQTPFACNGEHVSNEDMLNYDNENAIRKLTEFGENYETWINAEHDSDELKLLKPPVVIEKPEIEAYGEQEQPIKTDVSTSPIPFLDEKIDELNEKVVDTSSTTTTTTSTTEKIECKSTQTATKSVVDSACMTTNDGQDNSKVTSCTMVCQSCGTSTANSYSSIKFYTSLALAGLFAFFFAVTQFSPDIHKTYTRPPPI